MKRITAPNDFDNSPRPRVFLAGGITNCPEWQWEVMDMLPDDLPGT